MRHRPPFMVAALRADVVEARALGNVDLHHLVEPRRCGAVFKHGQLRALFQLHAMVQDRVRSFGTMDINQRNGLRRLARHADQQPVRGKGRIQRRQGPLNGNLPPRLEHAVKPLRPMDVTRASLGQTLDFHPRKRRIVRLRRVEHAIDEDQLHTVDPVENRRFVIGGEQRRLGRIRHGQTCRIGIAPVFVALPRQAHRRQPLQRRTPCSAQPAFGRIGQPRDPRRKRVLLRDCQSHQFTSARRSA